MQQFRGSIAVSLVKTQLRGDPVTDDKLMSSKPENKRRYQDACPGNKKRKRDNTGNFEIDSDNSAYYDTFKLEATGIDGLGSICNTDIPPLESSTTTEQLTLNNPRQGLSKEQRVTSYSVSVEKLRRIQNVIQIRRQILDRCIELEESLHLQRHGNSAYCALLENLLIFVEQGSEIDRLLQQNTGEAEEQETKLLCVCYSSPNNLPGENPTTQSLFIDEKGIRVIQSKTSKEIFLDCDIQEELHNDEKPLHKYKIAISSYIERQLLEPLKEKCVLLSDFLQVSSKEVNNGELTKSTARYTKEQIGEMVQNRDKIKSLIGDILSLFNRSVVPESERPKIQGFDRKTISKEVVESLYQLDDTIKGYYVRYSTLYVEVEPLENKEADSKRKDNIGVLLTEQGVTDFEIVQDSSEWTDYSYVGAKIGAGYRNQRLAKSGTLGCFVNMTKDRETSLHAITARHVLTNKTETKTTTKTQIETETRTKTETKTESEIKTKTETNTKTETATKIETYTTVYAEDGISKIASDLPKTMKRDGLDIAAAKIDYEKVSECDTRFKDFNGSFQPAVLHMSDGIDLQDLPVYMRGGRTMLGKGKIVAAYSGRREGRLSYIKVQDREVGSKMAQEGDSGAIILADDLDGDKVQVISMLKASCNHDESERDPTILKNYSTIRLSDGLKYLQDTTGSSVELCGT